MEWVVAAFAAVLVATVVILIVLGGLTCRALQDAKLRLAEEAEALEAEREREHRKLAEQRALAEREASRRRAELEQEVRLAVSRAVQAAREAAAERYKADPPPATLEERNLRLKEAQLRGEHFGRVLTVRVLASPTGYVDLEWILDPRIPHGLRVECERNKAQLFTDYLPRGSFVDFVCRGAEHRYRFHAYDGKRDEEPDFAFIVRLPTPEEWSRTVDGEPAPPTDGDAARAERIKKKVETLTAEEALWEEGRKQGHGLIDAGEGSDTEKRRKKAAFDARLVEEREREDEQGP